MTDIEITKACVPNSVENLRQISREDNNLLPSERAKLREAADVIERSVSTNLTRYYPQEPTMGHNVMGEVVVNSNVTRLLDENAELRAVLEELADQFNDMHARVLPNFSVTSNNAYARARAVLSKVRNA